MNSMVHGVRNSGARCPKAVVHGARRQWCTVYEGSGARRQWCTKTVVHEGSGAQCTNTLVHGESQFERVK